MDQRGLLDLITALQIGLAVTARRAGVTEAVVSDLNRIINDMVAMAAERGETDVSSVALANLVEHLSDPRFDDLAD